MDPGEGIGFLFIMLVPISAIVCGTWQKIVKMTQQHREEMARIQASQGVTAGVSGSEVSMLRQELATLRDTTTQYDLSVERNMREMLQRLQHLEMKDTAARTGGIEATSVPASSPASVRAGYVPETRPHQQPDETAVRLQAGN